MATQLPTHLLGPGAVIGSAFAFSTSPIGGSGFSNWPTGVMTNAMGGEILSVVYTPKLVGSKLLITATSAIRRDAIGDFYAILAIFTSLSPNAVSCQSSQAYSSGFPSHPYTCQALVTVPSLAAITVSSRGAAYSAHTGTVYLNYSYHGATEGGASLSVLEVAA